MTGSLVDHSLGLKQESTFNTPVTVDRFFEWLRGNSIDWDPRPIEAEGIQQTYGGFQLTTRRVAGVGIASGSLKFELLTKSFGTLLNACLGTVTSALVGGSGSTYQQVHTPAVAAAVLPSLTIQEGIYLPDGSTTTYTYAGCTVKGFEVDVPSGGIATLMVDIDGRSLATGDRLRDAELLDGDADHVGAADVGRRLHRRHHDCPDLDGAGLRFGWDRHRREVLEPQAGQRYRRWPGHRGWP